MVHVLADWAPAHWIETLWEEVPAPKAHIEKYHTGPSAVTMSRTYLTNNLRDMFTYGFKRNLCSCIKEHHHQTALFATNLPPFSHLSLKILLDFPDLPQLEHIAFYKIVIFMTALVTNLN